MSVDRVFAESTPNRSATQTADQDTDAASKLDLAWNVLDELTI